MFLVFTTRKEEEIEEEKKQKRKADFSAGMTGPTPVIPAVVGDMPKRQ
jgi:hypothetical protein